MSYADSEYQFNFDKALCIIHEDKLIGYGSNLRSKTHVTVSLDLNTTWTVFDNTKLPWKINNNVTSGPNLIYSNTLINEKLKFYFIGSYKDSRDVYVLYETSVSSGYISALSDPFAIGNFHYFSPEDRIRKTAYFIVRNQVELYFLGAIGPINNNDFYEDGIFQLHKASKKWIKINDSIFYKFHIHFIYQEVIYIIGFNDEDTKHIRSFELNSKTIRDIKPTGDIPNTINSLTQHQQFVYVIDSSEFKYESDRHVGYIYELDIDKMHWKKIGIPDFIPFDQSCLNIYKDHLVQSFGSYKSNSQELVQIISTKSWQLESSLRDTTSTQARNLKPIDYTKILFISIGVILFFVLILLGIFWLKRRKKSIYITKPVWISHNQSTIPEIAMSITDLHKSNCFESHPNQLNLNNIIASPKY